MSRIGQVEAIWLDGTTPTQQLGSESRIVLFDEESLVLLLNLPVTKGVIDGFESEDIDEQSSAEKSSGEQQSLSSPLGS
jgi:hypothetical protein